LLQIVVYICEPYKLLS